MQIEPNGLMERCKLSEKQYYLRIGRLVIATVPY